jgi:hypothetical protein
VKRQPRLTKREKRAASDRVDDLLGLTSRDFEFEDGDRCHIASGEKSGDRKLLLSPLMSELMQKQFDSFKEKFGREMRDDDPVFFDPDFDEPTPIDPYKERLGLVAALLLTGARTEMVYATARTMLPLPVDGLNDHLISDEDAADWDSSVREYLEARPDGAVASRAEGPNAVVYVLRGANDGLVKIGTTTDLSGRLRAIRSMSAVPIELLCVFPGDASVEKQAHMKFREHRRHGEWFQPAPDLMAWVEQMRWGA